MVRHEKDSVLGDDEDDTTSSPAGHDKEREDLNAPFLSEKIVTSRLVAVEDKDMHTTGDRIPSAMGANSSPLSDEPTSAHANSAIPCKSLPQADHFLTFSELIPFFLQTSTPGPRRQPQVHRLYGRMHVI